MEKIVPEKKQEKSLAEKKMDERIARELKHGLATSSAFRRPAEAPVFHPSEAEFRDPLAYINKIKPFAERTGICRIKPPTDWQPPFAVDIQNFKFRPRLQRLNELEAVTRLKLSYMEEVSLYWDCQGVKIKIPFIEGKTLDLYSLHQIVTKEGGWDLVSAERKWGKIARQMGIISYRCTSSVLKLNYERLLTPFNAFKAAIMQKNYYRKRKTDDQDSSSFPLNQICLQCNLEDDISLVYCFYCDGCFHKLCLGSILFPYNPQDWRCPKCVADEFKKRNDVFGFDESKVEYSLIEFGEMADNFKSNYFNAPAHTIPLAKVENEFWKIVSSLDDIVTVEYGSDLHSIDRGSGFPTRETINLDSVNPDIMKYVDSPWNLNNIPILDGSVFSYVPGKISGVKTPWMYVGMCFATFCWHIEDHWSYSINYLHWGEAKTWYGIPGAYANEFEKAMDKEAHELFILQPDLLHQLTTMFNPGVLMDNGVPVFRTDQQAGEFVITFPRAYHSGFNQGYNCAEAVNFAPADWIAMGRECVTHYADIQRTCVFSHDELICKIAVEADRIDPRIAAAAFYDFINMVQKEAKFREELKHWGVTRVAKIDFEEYPDETRQCDYCKTICFISNVTCKCSKTKMVCIQHYKLLCDCPPAVHTLGYKFTLLEVPRLLQKLKLKAQVFDTWTVIVKEALNSKSQMKTSDLKTLKILLSQAKEKTFPTTVVDPLLTAVDSLYKEEKSPSPVEIIELDD